MYKILASILLVILLVTTAPGPARCANEHDDTTVPEPPATTNKQATLTTQVTSLDQSLANASVRLAELTPSARPGKLGNLERKAFEYDTIKISLRLKDKEIANIKGELDDAMAVIEEQKVLIAQLRTTTNQQALVAAKRDKAQGTLNLIRLGKYEYYEIRDGDTCESIAAQPTIYGETAKHHWIRQANRGNIADLDKLVPGEMLTIPRYPKDGHYEF